MCSIVSTFCSPSGTDDSFHMLIEPKDYYKAYVGKTVGCDLDYHQDNVDPEENMSDEDIFKECCKIVAGGSWSDVEINRGSNLLHTMFRFLMLRHNPTIETVHNLLITLDATKESFQSQGIDVSKLIMAEELVKKNKFCDQDNCRHYLFGTHEENQVDGYMTILANGSTSNDLVPITLTSESLWTYNEDPDTLCDPKDSLVKGVSGYTIYDLLYTPTPTWARVFRQRPSEFELELANKRFAPDSFIINKLGVFVPMKGATSCCKSGTDLASLLTSFARSEADKSIYFHAILEATSVRYMNLIKPA